MVMDKNLAISLLRSSGCDEKLIAHCIAVSVNAKKIADVISEKRKIKIDLNLVETGALLHDIGRSKIHGITHGIEGAKILADYPELARICERHIGAGMSKDEAVKLGLENKDYIPETIEEKIIAHADNLTSGTKTVGIEKTIKKFERRLGKDHPSVKRIIELNDFIENLMK